MEDPKSRSWSPRTVGFKNFYNDCKEGLYDLNPSHQRQVVHSVQWKGDIIKSALQFNDIPLVRFHQVKQSDGRVKWESLDGKQRCSAIIEYLDNQYEIQFTWIGWPEKKIKYKDLPADKKQRIDELSLDMKLLSETLSYEEISLYFQWAQNTKTTTLGEHLNSMLHSEIGSKLRGLISRMKEQLDNFKPIATVDRCQHLEIMARLIYAYDKHCTPNAIKFFTGQQEIKRWWLTFHADDETFEYFTRTVQCLLTLLNETNFIYKSKNNTFLPIYWYLLKHVVDVNGSITKNRQLYDKLFTKLQDDTIKFTSDDAGGTEDHNGSSVVRRYQYLCELMV